MRIFLISNDVELHKALENSGYFNVTITNKLNEIDKSDAVIVSDKEIDFNEFSLSYDKELNKASVKYIFYMLSNDYNERKIDHINSISHSKKIIIIPPKLSISQIVNRVIEKMYPRLKKTSNITTFFGADSKVGTTMIAQSVSEVLANNTTVKIALLHLNSGSISYYKKGNDRIGLDDIKIKLLNSILHPDEFIEACTKLNDNLYVLPGISYLPDLRHYHPEHIDQLIKLASEQFGIVIIDAGSNIDSGMAIAALNATKNKYLITTQQESTRFNFERIEGQILKRLSIEPSDFLLIVNKYLKLNSIYSAKQVAEFYNMTLSTYIPHLEFIGWQAEYDHKSLLHYHNEAYSQQIEQLSKLIAVQTYIPFSEKVGTKRNAIKRVLSLIGG